MTADEQTTLWLGAFRYYCGRMTYAVSDFCEMLVAAWPTLTPSLRNLIAGELEGEFRRDDEMRDRGASYLPLGNQCDRESWERVRGLWKVGDGDTANEGHNASVSGAEPQAERPTRRES